MIVFQNDFVILSYDDTSHVFTVEYTKDSIDLTDESYEKLIDLMGSYIDETMPELLISDMRDLQYIVTPEQRNKINGIFNKTNRMRKVKKLAKIVSPDVYVQRTVDKNPAEDTGFNYKQKYFTKHKDALDWLKRNN